MSGARELRGALRALAGALRALAGALRALPGALLFASAACGHIDMHELALRPSSGPSPHEVQVYFETRAPDQAFYDVALLQATGFGGEANIDALVKAMLVRAAELGCDAVVRCRVDLGDARANAYGVCVRFSAPRRW